MVISAQNFFFKTAHSTNNELSVLSTLITIKSQVHGVSYRTLSNFSFTLQQRSFTKKNIHHKEEEPGTNKIELSHTNYKSNIKTQATVKHLFISQSHKAKSIIISNMNKKSVSFNRRSGFDIPKEGDSDYDSWAEKIVQFYEKTLSHNAAVDDKASEKKHQPK